MQIYDRQTTHSLLFSIPTEYITPHFRVIKYGSISDFGPYLMTQEFVLVLIKLVP